MSSYRDLKVWQMGMELVIETYRIARDLPRCELYGLGAQLRRAAVSVPSNIAEGHARRSRGDYRRHLGIARGSIAELETQLLTAERLGYIPMTKLEKAIGLCDEVSRMLVAIQNYLRVEP